MRVWRKKPQEEASAASVARAALAGASREKLVREALRVLTQRLVWDRIAREESPPGWNILSLEPPLPAQLLFGEKLFEQNLEDSAHHAVIGQLVGLRHALWVPIADQSRVKGLILLGGVTNSPASSLERAQSVAAELALAIEAEDQRRGVRMCNVELALIRRTVEARPDAPSLDKMLADLVSGCVHPSTHGESLGGTFAVIGVLASQNSNSSSNALDFLWRAGEEVWTRAIATDPLAKLWRRALETRRIIGSDPPVTWPQASVARIVALPLEAEAQLLGILVAGLPASAVSITTLDRLELRARLAAFALLRSKRNEEESRAANAEQSLLDLVADPLFLLDHSGRVTASSRGARELFRRAGKTAALPSGHLSDLFCGRDRERLGRWLQQSLNPSSAPAIKKETPQGELQNGIKVRLQLAPRLPSQPPAVLLEPEKAAESRRQTDHAEAELQNVIGWLEEGVVLFDERENVRAVNTRFEQMVGLTPEESGKIKTLEEWIARLAGQAVQPEQFAKRWRELARNIQGGVREPLQMAHPAPRVLERAARPVFDAHGHKVGRVEIYRDLTAQRALHSKLLQTEKLAALGQMVSGIAHELSSPLTTILGYAQRLIAGPNALGRTEEAREIYQEAERASSILRRLLLNARETIPERRLVSLNQIVMRATELQRFTLAAEKIRVELELDPALPFIHGDAGQLQQVLINLLGNARHALEEQGQGGVIRLRTRTGGGRSVLLEVQDSGPGIPQAIQARIFDPFFTTKPAGVGTGLGLSIVMSVVREHGGSVHLQSPPQGGALFQIEIPAATERQQEDALGSAVQHPAEPRLRERETPFPETPHLSSVANPRAKQPPTTASLRGEQPGSATSLRAEQPSNTTSAAMVACEPTKGARVLVVEDEPTVARLIADVLEDEGMRVDVLLDGREALERAAREAYDLVICDMKMPGLDGQRFYRALERNGNSLRERFLFVTGDVMAAQTRGFLERTGLPHVAKPFRVEELTEKVRAVLQTQRHAEFLAAEVARKNAARNG